MFIDEINMIDRDIRQLTKSRLSEMINRDSLGFLIKENTVGLKMIGLMQMKMRIIIITSRSSIALYYRTLSHLYLHDKNNNLAIQESGIARSKTKVLLCNPPM